MPYKIKKKEGGYKVTTPNHPEGFSKKPQSKEGAIKQMVAIKENSGEEKGEAKKKVGVRKAKKG